jgi:hypothetical protein
VRLLLLRRVPKLGGIVVTALVFSGMALAYFTSVGSGSGTGGSATLSAPAITSATPGAGAVALSWSSVTPPGSGAVTYYVTRDGATPGGDCPTAASPSSATSCTDSGVSIGTHSYTVTALWRTWTATSSAASATVAFGPASHFVLSAATTTPVAGAADNLTITAKDASNNTVLTYAGSHSLTFGGAAAVGGNNPTVTDSSGTPINFGTATTITFSSGVASVSGSSNGVMTLYKAETASIVVTDGSISNGSGLSVTVSAAAQAGIILSGITTNPSPPLTCSGAVGAISCISSGEPALSGNQLVARFTLADGYQNPVTNTTGGPLTISLSATGNGSVTPSSLSVANGSSQTSATFTLTRTTGTGKSVTMTASLGSQTLTATLSS